MFRMLLKESYLLIHTYFCQTNVTLDLPAFVPVTFIHQCCMPWLHMQLVIGSYVSVLYQVCMPLLPIQLAVDCYEK